MSRFISSDAMGWRVLRFITIGAGGVVAMRVLAEILGRHYTGSLYPSMSFGAPVGFSLAPGNLFGAIDRGRQKYTMAQMQDVARAIEEGRPVGRPVDGRGTPFLIERSGASYTIVSFGDCGEPDLPRGAKYSEGTTMKFSADIVMYDGRFVRYPQGVQR